MKPKLERYGVTRCTVLRAGVLMLFSLTGGLWALPAGEMNALGNRDPQLVRPIRLNLPMDIAHLIHEADVALVRLRIDTDGKVIDWIPLELPHHRLVGALETSLATARFLPAMESGEVVVVDMLATIPVGEASSYGVFNQSQLEHIESRLSWIDPDRYQLSLSMPDQLDAPLKMISQGQPRVVFQDDGNLLKGSVNVTFYVDSRGHPRMIRTEESAPIALRQAAHLTVSEFVFDPPKRKNQPTVVKARIQLVF